MVKNVLFEYLFNNYQFVLYLFKYAMVNCGYYPNSFDLIMVKVHHSERGSSFWTKPISRAAGRFYPLVDKDRRMSAALRVIYQLSYGSHFPRAVVDIDDG